MGPDSHIFASGGLIHGHVYPDADEAASWPDVGVIRGESISAGSVTWSHTIPSTVTAGKVTLTPLPVERTLDDLMDDLVDMIRAGHLDRYIAEIDLAVTDRLGK